MSRIEEKTLTILIVDDTPANIDLLEAILSPEYFIQKSTRGGEVLAIARETQPDLIMLDIVMPDMSGYEVCRALKADAATNRIPVIFVTSLLQPGDEELGFEVGGVDYITKPVIRSIVRARVKVQLALMKTQKQLEAQNDLLRHAKEGLEISRNKYAELYNCAPVSYFTFDLQGHIREANLTGSVLIGREMRSLNNIPFKLFIADAEGREAFANHLKTVLQNEGMHSCEIILSKNDGMVIYTIFRSIAMAAHDNTDRHILSSIIDVTEAKRMETEIQDARDYAESIVETVRKPLVVLNSDLKILTANLNFYETFNVTPEETIGYYIYDLGNRQWDIPKLRLLLDNIILHHTVFNGYEVEHDFQGIGHKVILLNAREIYRKNSGTHIILLAMEDYTERKKLEEERAQLAMIVESANDAIFSVSPENIITSWNGGAENIFGYSAGEIIGELIFTLIPSDLHHERSHIWQTILSGEQLRYFETTRIRKDGSKIYVSITASPLLDTEGKISGNSVIARDVTEHRKLEELLKHQAHHDILTGLPNRQLFMDLLFHELAQARRNKKKLALLFLDLDGFKLVNDTYGHDCGDKLLQEVAIRLKASIRESDIVARLGGDEFTILMPDCTNADDVGFVLKKIQGVFKAPFIFDKISLKQSTSIGVCMFPDGGTNGEELMKNADSAMYAAKESGKNAYRFYPDAANVGAGTA